MTLRTIVFTAIKWFIVVKITEKDLQKLFDFTLEKFREIKTRLEK